MSDQQTYQQTEQQVEMRRGQPMAAPPHADEHGHSVAAWTGVGIILLGCLVASLAVALLTVWLFVVGLVICAIGVAAGKLLSMAGFGSPKDQPEPNRTGS